MIGLGMETIGLVKWIKLFATKSSFQTTTAFPSPYILKVCASSCLLVTRFLALFNAICGIHPIEGPNFVPWYLPMHIQKQ